MKHLILGSLLYLFPLIFVHPALGQGADIGPFLEDALSRTGDDALLDVIVYLEETGDLDALKRQFKAEGTPVNERPKAVMRLLKTTADATQKDLISFIEDSHRPHGDIRRFWIANAIAVKAGPALIHAIAARQDVSLLLLNRSVFAYNDPPTRESGGPKSVGGTELGLIAVGAPEMWAMGYTGQGRLALTFDTGVWDDHPAHKDRFLGNLMPYESTWFAYDSPIPVDKSSSHGTHVTGIMLGLDTATADTIGMAPKAYFIATDPVVSNLAYVKPLTDFMFGYEWAMNPDGDEETSTDIPDVINNSWGFGPDLDEAPCPEFVIPVFTALELAGIANVFSAGNEGPGDQTISVPHNTNIGLVNSFTVGAVSSNSPYPIASFSSRGPSVCGGTGSLLIKPEVSAPGVNVRSSVEYGDYDLYSGTSMAAPHVSGAVLLLKEAFPFLTGEDILLALYYSATDLGEEGEDNTYGMGMINVKNAFDYLAETHTPVPPASSGVDVALVEIIQPQLDVITCNVGDTLHISPVLRIRNNGSAIVNTYTISYGFVDGPEFSIAVNDPLDPGTSADIALPEMGDAAVGPRAFHAYIEPLENEYDIWNNHKIVRWLTMARYDWASEGPFIETFDGGLDSTIWSVYNPDGAITWDTLSALQIDGNIGPAAWMNHHRYNIIRSQKDHLISPLISNMPLENQVLTFDYFYRKRELNPFAFDTLIVTLTRLCGDEYPGEELYHAGGFDFFTVVESQANALPEETGQWQTLSFDLELIDDNPFYFSFITVNRNGNNLLIDNVRINDGTRTHNAAIGPRVDLYPNPTSGAVRASWTGGPAEVTLFDNTGRMIQHRKRVDPGSSMDFNSPAPGLYSLRFGWPDGRRASKKLVIH